MTILLIYCILFLVLAYVYGIIPFILTKKILPVNPITPLILGIAVLGLLSQWFFIGGSINGFTFFVLLAGALLAIWRYWYFYRLHLINIANWFRSLTTIQYTSIAGMLLVVLYQSALPSKINDMGMYYLQTIQWMREYGAIKGLGNLHPALGLGSAWHSLLVLTGDNHFMTDLLGSREFAINGFLIFILYLFLIAELRLNFSIYLLAYFILLFPLAFFYLTAPSPDLPVLAFIPLLFYWTFIHPSRNFEMGGQGLPIEFVLLIACFIFACKPPAFLAVLLAVGSFIFILYNRKWKTLALIMFLVVAALGPVLYKNYLQTGYPLYPSAIEFPIYPNAIKTVDISAEFPENTSSKLATTNQRPVWKIPADWNEAYRKGIQTWGLNDLSDQSVLKGQLPGALYRLRIWLNRTGYKGFMNHLIFWNAVLTILLLLYMGWRRQLDFRYSAISIGMLSLGILEWFYLSQYRLLLPGVLTLFCWNMDKIVFLFRFEMGTGDNYRIQKPGINRQNFSFKKLNRIAPILLTLVYISLAFIPFEVFQANSRNKSITRSSGFTFDYLLKPFSYNHLDEQVNYWVDSIPFHRYKNRTYMWDCSIPSVSLSHQQFLKESFGYNLHAYGSKITDGFYLSKD